MTMLPPLTVDDLVRVDRRSRESEPGFGTLTSDQGHLPLVAMDVAAHLTGLVSSVSIRQSFRNCLGVAIEATYIFPLPDRAAVTDFAVTIGGRRIVGILKERQAARDSYDRAIEAGQQAAIVEEERPDIFTTRVGNLAPGEDAVVELALAGWLPYEDGEATFRFPLVVAPRYVPGRLLPGESVGGGTVLDTDAVPDASRIRPPVLLPGVPNPVQLSLSATVDPAGLEVCDLRSSLHAVTTSGALPGPVTLEIESGERLDRDFILRFRVGGDHRSSSVSCVAVPDAEGVEGTFVVTVLPPLSGRDGRPAAPRDVVVALDHSGSMGGWKMVAARRAAARIIDSLTSADRFSVLAFDHVVEQPPSMTPGRLVEATDRNRFLAVEWLARLEARGGTELLPALTQALTSLPSSDGNRSRTCVLVTDGQVANEDQLVSAAANHQGIRIFTVGIDRAVNAGLLRRLAAIGGGHCDLVESEDRLDEVMAAVHRRIGHPVLEAVTAQLPSMKVLAGTVTPDGAADVFPGVPLVIAGRYQGEAAGCAVVTSSVGGPSLDAPVTIANSGAAAAVWARAHLRDLEDRYASSSRGTELDQMEEHIVAVSLRHRVLCRFTAFVAVDDSGHPVSGEPHQIVQPVQLPSGWSHLAVGAVGGVMRPMAESAGWKAAAMPAPSAGAPGRDSAFRVPPGAQPFSGRVTPTAEPIGLEGYADRFIALMATLESMPNSSAAAADARALAGDLRSVGGPDEVVRALEAVADALDAGDRGAVTARTKELRGLLDGLGTVGDGRGRQGWWRR
jgi:Ca-activated chloride channel homolog